MKFEELSNLLNGTGAEIIRLHGPIFVAPKHQFRLATPDEVIDYAENPCVKEIKGLVDMNGNPLSYRKEEKYISVVVQARSFSNLAYVKANLGGKRFAMFDSNNAQDKDCSYYRVRCAVFGEHLHWGPRKIRRK